MVKAHQVQQAVNQQHTQLSQQRVPATPAGQQQQQQQDSREETCGP
jgi:hypothetical protein